MAYPEEIIEELKNQYNLEEAMLQALRATLDVSGMQQLLESGILLKEHLLSPSPPYAILPVLKANMLVSTYNQAQLLEGFNAINFPSSQTILWLSNGNEPYAYVFSPNAAKKIVENPALLKALKQVAIDLADTFKKWDNLKTELYELSCLSHAKFKERKRRADELLKTLLPLAPFIINNPLLGTEYSEVSSVILQYMNATSEPLENAATLYFEQLFKQQGKTIDKIYFSAKLGGDQMGKKMTISYKTLESQKIQSIVYFVKTHQHGSNSRVSSARAVDPKELLIYKVLEYAGFGPKAHFFYNPLSSGGFFIATQDVAYTKVTQKDKTFFLYDQLREDKQHPLAVDSTTCAGIASMDILSRIFRLYDVTTNPSNFGRVSVNGFPKKWKIIDFRIDTMDSYKYNDIFKGFQEGNGMFNYTEFIGEVLRDRPEEERMETAAHVIDQLRSGGIRPEGRRKMPLLVALTKASDEITDYIQKKAGALHLDSTTAINDLQRYIAAVQENFTTLAEKIDDRYTILKNSNRAGFN